MPTSTTRITMCGIDLDCEFDWDEYRPQTYWEPAEGGFQYITKVFHNGEDIIELLSESIIDELETMIKEKEND